MKRNHSYQTGFVKSHVLAIAVFVAMVGVPAVHADDSVCMLQFDWSQLQATEPRQRSQEELDQQRSRRIEAHRRSKACTAISEQHSKATEAFVLGVDALLNDLYDEATKHLSEAAALSNDKTVRMSLADFLYEIGLIIFDSECSSFNLRCSSDLSERKAYQGFKAAFDLSGREDVARYYIASACNGDARGKHWEPLLKAGVLHDCFIVDQLGWKHFKDWEYSKSPIIEDLLRHPPQQLDLESWRKDLSAWRRTRWQDLINSEAEEHSRKVALEKAAREQADAAQLDRINTAIQLIGKEQIIKLSNLLNAHALEASKLENRNIGLKEWTIGSRFKGPSNEIEIVALNFGGGSERHYTTPRYGCRSSVDSIRSLSKTYYPYTYRTENIANPKDLSPNYIELRLLQVSKLEGANVLLELWESQLPSAYRYCELKTTALKQHVTAELFYYNDILVKGVLLTASNTTIPHERLVQEFTDKLKEKPTKRDSRTLSREQLIQDYVNKQKKPCSILADLSLGSDRTAEYKKCIKDVENMAALMSMAVPASGVSIENSYWKIGNAQLSLESGSDPEGRDKVTFELDGIDKAQQEIISLMNSVVQKHESHLKKTKEKEEHKDF